jgi:hypothetical protein
MRMRFLKRLPFLRRKEEEVAEVEKPEVKVEREFPGISEAELRRHMDEHIAIVGGKIVASAGTARRALAAAKRKHSGEDVELRYVASKRLLLKCKCLEEK